MAARFDPRLCLCIGPEDCGGRDPADVTARAVRGGVTMVQLRWKDAPVREFAALGRRLMQVTRQLLVPFIVNDHPDIALAIGADGVHVGQSDTPPARARALLGPHAIIGLSIDAAEQIAAIDATVDYIGCGPVFATATKSDHAAPKGIDGFAALRRQMKLPVMAIGGVKASHAAALRAAGADGLAVVSAITAAADPAAAARNLRAAFDA
jgi:thiamine-phosphate pyrophosphorylase